MELSKEVKNLEDELQFSKDHCALLEKELLKAKEDRDYFKHVCEMAIPEKVFTHKVRRNTTVKFRDGSSVTVKRKSGEKDCIETAIAYCLMKNVLTPQYLNKLIKEREEH
jgi:hypothetical protein